MNKRILITGGAGFIGLHLGNHLLDHGYSILLVDNHSRGVSDLDLNKILENDRAKFINCDLIDSENVLKLGRDFSTIFHLAAIVGVSHVSKEPNKVLSGNIKTLENIIELGKRQEHLTRLLFASTSEVYAGTLEKLGMNIPTPESTLLAVPPIDRPRTSYMLSKIYGEAMCYHSNLPFTIFRPHNVYGPRMGMSHVIPEQLKKAYFSPEGQSIDVFSPDHTRCFCYVDDALQMMRKMMETENCQGETLNLGVEAPELTIKEVVGECHKAVGKSLIFDYKEETEGSPVRRAPDMNKTKSLIGYDGAVSITEGIYRTYAWYRKNVFEANTASAI